MLDVFHLLSGIAYLPFSYRVNLSSQYCKWRIFRQKIFLTSIDVKDKSNDYALKDFRIGVVKNYFFELCSEITISWIINVVM